MISAPPSVGLDDRLVDAATGALDLFSVHLGRRLGLYDAVQAGGTVAEVSSRAAINSRYAREWLEHQAVAGFIVVDDESAPWDQREYRMNSHQVDAFVDPDHPSHVSPLADMIVGIGSVMDKVSVAFSQGTGVPYAEYGSVFREGQANVNRPAFINDLVDVWLAGAVPDIAAALASGGRVADLGCGVGWSTVSMAAGFPRASVVGYDSDAASIEDAQSLARTHGSSAEFKNVDAAQLEADGPFDLIVVLEALHDMADPVAVLESARRALKPGGAVVVADEAVHESFTTSDSELDQMFYGWSVVHCLPAAMAEEPSAALGTVVRPHHVRAIAEEAGFKGFELANVDGGFFHIYVVR